MTRLYISNLKAAFQFGVPFSILAELETLAQVQMPFSVTIDNCVFNLEGTNIRKNGRNEVYYSMVIPF